MYYPWGWPKVLGIPQRGRRSTVHVAANRDRLLFAALTDDSLGIWHAKPCVLVVQLRRSAASLQQLGCNLLAVWKTDSSALAVLTTLGYILFYDVTLDEARNRSLLTQVDSKNPSLQRESAELYIKSRIPSILIALAFTVQVQSGITSVCSLKNELLVATRCGGLERYEWSGRLDRELSLDLNHIPFYVDQQDCRGVVVGDGVWVTDLEYSPILSGVAVVLSDGRAALLIAPSLKFKPNELKGLWALDVVDAVHTAVNHKHLLIAFGRKNGQTVVCHIDEITGGLQISHQLLLSSKDYPDASSLGPVQCAKWSPDSCALVVTWKSGGIGMWSVYGALLWCSLGWDYQQESLNLTAGNCVTFPVVEWGAEGYQLWMSMEVRHSRLNQLAQLSFIKSSLTVNPCMSNHGHLLLQAEDRLYLNAGRGSAEVWRQRIKSNLIGNESEEQDQHHFLYSPNSLLANKQWIVVMIPSAYNNTNWPIRHVAVDKSGKFMAVAGRAGVAHCCLQTKKWKLFGNETQEKDFVVNGGLLWWQDQLLLGCYNIHDDRDEIRLYPRDNKLDNSHAKTVVVAAPVLLLNILKNRLLAFFADNHIGIFNISSSNGVVEVVKEQSIDISNLSIHPVCVSHVVLVSRMEDQQLSSANLNNSGSTSGTTNNNHRRHHHHTTHYVNNILVNVCGRVIMFQLTSANDSNTSDSQGPIYVNPTVLATNVESIWVSERISRERRHLVESLLFGCGAQGMKVWLPLFLADVEKTRHFMSKWIMLPMSVNIYPLSVLFEDAVILGVESDNLLLAADPTKNGFSHPFCLVERSSQVYLHHILRQLLRRNLGNHAWEIARSCSSLSHFPHALELLLHEVLEDEATSKEPIPDALLPRVVEFIREFPVYLKTVVQCARKIEIALWPHLFAVVDRPHNLFQECLRKRQLSTGASYLLILQNLEPSSISRQYATRLLDAALDQGEWQLCKDLVRFLRAIDPSDVESPPRSNYQTQTPNKFSVVHPTPPTSPNEDISFVLGTMQLSRTRAYSVSTTSKICEHLPGHASHAVKDGGGGSSRTGSVSDPRNIPLRRRSGEHSGKESANQEFFIDVILKRHARKLLDSGRLLDLGRFAAHLDFHLVSWLRKERSRAAMVYDFVPTLKKIHQDFQWPYPVPPHSFSFYLAQNQAKSSGSGLEDGVGVVRSEGSREEARDSGYLSHSSGIQLNKQELIEGGGAGGVQTMEAQLRPRTVSGEDESVRTLDLSEDSSIWGEGEPGLLDEPSSWNGIQFNSEMEQMSAELASKGSPQSEVQLRYLLQLMMEANCLEWAVLMSVVLRDAMAVIRIVNAARASDVSQDMVGRLKEGLASLEEWADKECLGYKRFMHTIRNQSLALSRMTWSTLRMRSPSPSSLIEGETNDDEPDEVTGELDDLEVEIEENQLRIQDEEELELQLEEREIEQEEILMEPRKEARKEVSPNEQSQGVECVLS